MFHTGCQIPLRDSAPVTLDDDSLDIESVYQLAAFLDGKTGNSLAASLSMFLMRA